MLITLSNFDLPDCAEIVILRFVPTDKIKNR